MQILISGLLFLFLIALAIFSNWFASFINPVVIFWVAIVFFIFWAGGLVRALINPRWYAMKQIQAGLVPSNLYGSGELTKLLMSKGIILIIVGSIVWRFGSIIGYW